MRPSLLLMLSLTLLAFSACPPKPPCAPGQLDCACAEAQRCDEGVCGAEGKCVNPTFVSLQVSDPTARGCEVLLSEQPGTTFASAAWTQGVVGTALRQAPRVALTFVAPKDASLPAGSIQLALASGSAAGLSVVSATCVDVNGAKLAAASVVVK